MGSEVGDPVNTLPVFTSLIDQVAAAKAITVSLGNLRPRVLTSNHGSVYQFGQDMLITLD